MECMHFFMNFENLLISFVSFFKAPLHNTMWVECYLKTIVVLESVVGEGGTEWYKMDLLK